MATRGVGNWELYVIKPLTADLTFQVSRDAHAYKTWRTPNRTCESIHVERGETPAFRHILSLARSEETFFTYVDGIFSLSCFEKFQRVLRAVVDVS